MRKISAALLFMVAGGCLLVAGGALSTMWADYQDSPHSTYIEVAATFAVIALGFAALGVLLLRFRR